MGVPDTGELREFGTEPVLTGGGESRTGTLACPAEHEVLGKRLMLGGRARMPDLHGIEVMG